MRNNFARLISAIGALLLAVLAVVSWQFPASISTQSDARSIPAIVDRPVHIPGVPTGNTPASPTSNYPRLAESLDDSTTPLTSREVAPKFDEWLAMARNGDLAAARRIFDSLAHCARASRNGLATQVEASDSPDAGRKRALANWFDSHCSAYRPSHYARLLDVAEAGAKAGSDYLRAEYYALDPLQNGTIDSALFSAYRENARRFLTELVETGNPEGFLLMSDAYAAGRIVPRDESTAYAYFLAWQQAGSNDRQPPSAPPPYYRNLSADQIRQGQELARYIQQKEFVR